MRNGANAEIRGELKEDIIIKRGPKEGLVCGLIYVLINDTSEISSQISDANTKLNYVPVLLKGADIINKFGSSLKKGEKVWLVGKFEVVEKAYVAFEDFGFDNVSGFIISIHDKNRFRVITEDPILNAIPETNRQVIKIREYNSMSGSWMNSFH
jgi:hypothetical protein